VSNVTVAFVNKALKAKGIEERLVKGKDYMYFAEGNAHTWPVTMVCVMKASSLSIDEWLEEHATLSKRSLF
jgi:hypothetical protein